MKPTHQDKFGKYTGNCFQAMLASIFELPLEKVPNFMEGSKDGAWIAPLNEWLKHFGLFYIEISCAGTFLPDDVIHEISGDSPRFSCLHSVVGKGGAPIFDPHPSGEMLKGNFNSFGIFVARDPSRFVKNLSEPTL